MNKSRAPLALIEQVVMVLVFALAAAICLRVFVYCGLGSRNIEMEDAAMTAAVTIADAVKANDMVTLERYGLSFSAGSNIERTLLRGGRTFEEMGLHVAVEYTSVTEYLWRAAVIISSENGTEIVRLDIAGQMGGQYEQ